MSPRSKVVDISHSIALYGMQKNGDLEPLSLGRNFGGELTLRFMPRFTIGLGVGYIKFIKESTVIASDIWDTMEFLRRPQVEAIPITLSFYYSIPVGKSLKAVIGAGFG